MISPSIRGLLLPLLATPLHPQWLPAMYSRGQKARFAKCLHGRILDVGSGSNPILEWLPASVQYTSLDYPPAISKGYHGHADVHGDAQCLPFRDSSFDSVLALDVLEHLRNPGEAMREIQRVLRPGGTLIVQTPFLYPLHDLPDDYHRWTASGLSRLGGSVGLRLLDVYAHGGPLETAAALANIALSKCILDAIDKSRAAAILVPVLAVLIPALNVMGWLGGKIFRSGALMTLGYTTTFIRAESEPAKWP